jgi:hypothetical protein
MRFNTFLNKFTNRLKNDRPCFSTYTELSFLAALAQFFSYLPE